ncbi:TPA: MBL fold metallo-hydrolase [Photobacterium damselae]
MQIDILDAGHGDCLLVTCGDILILIDSGPKSLKIRRDLIKRLSTLLGGRTIDVAVITHNDDDHIGGFQYIIDSGIRIKSFIFNSLELLPKIIKKKVETKKISFRQDRQLHKLLSDKSIKVGTFQYEDLPIVLNELTFIPLTPNDIILSKLHEKAEKKIKKIAGKKIIEQTIDKCLEQVTMGTDHFIEDSSVTNKSSIAFILEYKGKRSIFLGDSHPSDVIAAIKSKRLDGIFFNAVKLSHHASYKNTNKELLELLGETEYIICADKSHHGHPNNKTISRILAFNSNAKFHLSADNELLRDMFSDCARCGYPVVVTYSKQGINRVCYE